MNPDPADDPRVSVIIPVKDDRVRLERCLDGLRVQSYPAPFFEVLVVDDASKHPIYLDEEDFPFRLKVVRATGAGSYAARNTGVTAARGGLLAFTDADCRPSNQWLAVGSQAALSLGRPVGGEIDVRVVEDRPPTIAETFELLMAFPQQRFIDASHFAATANLFVPRGVFEVVGQFDSRLESGGDREWGRRAWRYGFPVHYCSEARVQHPPRHSLRDLWLRFRRVARGRHALIRLHPHERIEPNRPLAHILLRFAIGRLIMGGSGPIIDVYRRIREGEISGWPTVWRCCVASCVAGAAIAVEEVASSRHKSISLLG